MDAYIGTKIVKAEPMDRHYFETQVKGREHEGENMSGYMVKYEDGYLSWSPKEVFDRAYRKISENEATSAVENLPNHLLLLDEDPEKARQWDFAEGLATIINKFGKDSEYGVRDDVLANYLIESLKVFTHFKNMVLVDERKEG